MDHHGDSSYWESWQCDGNDQDALAKEVCTYECTTCFNNAFMRSKKLYLINKAIKTTIKSIELTDLLRIDLSLIWSSSYFLKYHNNHSLIQCMKYSIQI